MQGKELVRIDGDYYCRYNFIKNIEKVIDSCVVMDKPMTFSIEGAWGKGKTWVINKLEESIKGLDITKVNTEKDLKLNNGKYIVFKYNAWEKDFYNEPLVAILLTIVNQLNDILLVENSFKVQVKSIIKESISVLEGALSTISKKILGFDVINVSRKAFKKFKDLKDEATIKLSVNDSQNIENDIKTVCKSLSNLSKEIPIVFIVDELDRCVPQNAIKTLERLHHIFGKINNSVTVISVHRKQLDNSIRIMFGNDVSTDTYLSKFIDFSISLDKGLTDHDHINEKLENFKNLFSSVGNEDYMIEVLYNVHQCVNARTFEKICRNGYMCHNIVNMDTSHLPLECFIAEFLLSASKIVVEEEGGDSGFSTECGNQPKTPLGKYLRELLKPAQQRRVTQNKSQNVVIYIICYVYGFTNGIAIGNLLVNNKELYEQINKYFSKYKEIFEIIK